MENPTPQVKLCPICGDEIKVGELLISYYYPPKDWWCIKHLIPKEQTQTEIIVEISDRGYKSRATILNMLDNCHESGFTQPLKVDEKGSSYIDKLHNLIREADALVHEILTLNPNYLSMGEGKMRHLFSLAQSYNKEKFKP